MSGAVDAALQALWNIDSADDVSPIPSVLVFA
jgi:hypothetical protein